MRKFITNIALISFLTCSLSHISFAEPEKELLKEIQLFTQDLVNTPLKQISHETTKNPSFFSKLCTFRNSMIIGTIAYGAYLFQRWNKFNAIQAWILNSSPIMDDNKYFSFARWQHDYAPLASDVQARSDELKSFLLNAPKNDIHIFNDNNNNEIKKPSPEAILNSFYKELKNVKKDLEFLTQFTEFPTFLLLYANIEFNQRPTDKKTLCNEILLQCTYCNREGKLSELEFLINQVEENLINPTFTIDNFLSFIDQFIYRPVILNPHILDHDKEKKYTTKKGPFDLNYQRSSNPFTWSFVFRKQAAQLYSIVLKRYMRLLALENIIFEYAQLKPQNSTKKKSEKKLWSD